MRIDAEVPLGDVTARLVRELAMLEPYGEGNPPPLLLARNLEAVGRHRRIGSDGQHLSFFVRSNSRGVRAVAFRMGHLVSRLSAHDGMLSLLFEPQIDTWRGTGEAELIVRDIRFE